MIQIVNGSILDSQEKYIAHQCNCITQKSAGTAKAIFDKYSYANTYFDRIEPDKLASIKILGNGNDQRYVINMFAQYYPGKPKYPNSSLDGVKAREKYFYQCLLHVSQISNLKSIAFPYGIGCNLGGGIWENYFGKLNNFAEYVTNKFGTKVFLYRLEK